jgi:hypothetical protein
MAIAQRLNRRHKAALFVMLVAAGASLVSGGTMKVGLGIILLGIAFTWAFGSGSRAVHRLVLACGLFIVFGSLGYAWEAHREKTTLYRDEIAQFEREIPDLAKMYHLLPYDVECPDQHMGPVDLSSGIPANWVPVKQPDGSYRYYPEDNFPDGDPPTGLRLTRDQLSHAIKTKDPACQTSANEKVVNHFLDRYPRWRTALVEDGASGDSQPKWYADAVVAGVNINAVPEEEKPDPPGPPKLWQSVGNGWVFIVLGLLLFFIGVGLLFGVKPNRNDSEIRSVSGG